VERKDGENLVARGAIGEVKQRSQKLVIPWVSKNYLEPLSASVSTHRTALGPRGGLWAVLLMCNP
jgi:hypothetical protein